MKMYTKFMLASALCWGLACTGSITRDDRGDESAGGDQEDDPSGGAAGTGRLPGGAGGAPDPAASSLPAARARRLTASQLRNTIDDLFGPGLDIPEVESEPALLGFTSVGASAVATSATGVERYDAAATAIAAQVFQNAGRRTALVGCVPTGAGDAPCARAFLARFGRLVYRRSLTAAELDRAVELLLGVGKLHGSFWKGAEATVTALLESPKFLYRAELGKASSNGRVRFEGAELASRLSFFVWNAAPDAALLDAAERGELDRADGLEAAATRLLASEKALRGFRTFFGEIMRLGSEREARDAARALSTRIPETTYLALREQTLLTMQRWFFEGNCDWPSLLRTPETFLSREIAPHYGMASGSTTLEPGTFGANAQRLGPLGHAAFLIKTSNPPDTSPSARGLVIRDAILCQDIPPPPPGVETDLPPLLPDKPVTMRERLRLHQNNPTCAACHRAIDSIGLGLENFDALGRWRTTEHGLPIDPSGDLDGVAFQDARGLLEALSRHPDTSRCFVRQLARHAIGQHEPEAGPIDDLARVYDQGGVSLKGLLIAMTKSPLFLEGSQAQ